MKRFLILIVFCLLSNLKVTAQENQKNGVPPSTAATPTNNPCSGATNLGTVSTTTTTTGTTTGCSADGSSSCFTPHKNVWYTFTVPAGGGSYDITINAGGLTNPDVAVYSGTCASLSLVACNGYCVGDFTGTASNVTVSVLCITAGTYYIDVDDDNNVCGGSAGTFSITVTQTSSGAGAADVCMLNYSYTNIPINIETAGVTTNITGNLNDDVLSNVVPIGFTFCYDGYQYTQLYVASNGALVFDAIDACHPNVNQPRIPAASGAATGYEINTTIPTTTDYTPQNAILGPWEDIDFTDGGSVKYGVLGTAPNRRLVVYFKNVFQFDDADCSGAANHYTGEMKLFETSNNIEIHVQNQASCADWNGGLAILGLHNAFGTRAVVPAGYNATAYNISNLAWQFTTPCATCIPIVLPVGLLNFTAVLNNKIVDLKWSTASESNNAYFTIEKSADGQHFEEFTRVNGAGNSSETSYYLTIDNTPLTGVSYYRLSQTDFNGNTVRFNIISVNNTDDDERFTAIPNPTEGIVNITYSCDAATTGTLKLFDGNGVLVLSKVITCVNGQNTSQLDLSQLNPGIYMIMFSTDTKFYRTKLMKR